MQYYGSTIEGRNAIYTAHGLTNSEVTINQKATEVVIVHWVPYQYAIIEVSNI